MTDPTANRSILPNAGPSAAETAVRNFGSTSSPLAQERRATRAGRAGNGFVGPADRGVEGRESRSGAGKLSVGLSRALLRGGATSRAAVDELARRVDGRLRL